MRLKQMNTTKEKVGDYTFYITPFPAFKAANLTGELASVLAPLLSAFVPLASASDGDLMDMDVQKAASALANCTSIDGDKLERLIHKLLIGGHIVVELYDEDGEMEAQRLDEDIVNEIFCGEIQDMFILCVHVIKLNFNGFFKKLVSPSGKVELAKTPRKIL